MDLNTYELDCKKVAIWLMNEIKKVEESGEGNLLPDYMRKNELHKKQKA